ncbi:Aste57867_14827 [Aphanomyces stellatus]|uniref:Aste57867_14827 protein n=1 Tax=Aphanomyces stellatus TaxID=120398 RepID=A0A485L1Z1_9STRA|nr:hypothetical protein As57867_014771 [Aphanomyces stellatus]VFT91645.1 Aste57867_14827 [Aphanomyces stellatus]
MSKTASSIEFHVKKTATRLSTIVAIMGFCAWILATVNTLLDPIKTLYGYYLYTDSWNQEADNRTMTGVHNFNNVSSHVCTPADKWTDCYYELPVLGPGSLANQTCRTFYPVEPVNECFGTFFGNCTNAAGQVTYLPSHRYVTNQWSIQTASTDKECLSRIGEGIIFPCQSYTSMNGRVLNYQTQRSEVTKWCREFGAWFVYDSETQIQEMLLANVSHGKANASLFSIPLEIYKPSINLMDYIGCSADLLIGGTATHTATTAWYGQTRAPWSARTTRVAGSNVISRNYPLMNVVTTLMCNGDFTMVRTVYKDGLRLLILLIITYYRISSIYYPLLLVYRSQNRPFTSWLWHRNMGLVLHKRERRNVIILMLLTIETLVSTEDILMFCQQVVYTDSREWLTILLKCMSICRVIWPCALIMLLLSRIQQALLPDKYAIAIADDLFFFCCPVVLFYVPRFVTSQGNYIFQGFGFSGDIIRHLGNSILQVSKTDSDPITLYFNLFGLFTAIATTFCYCLSLFLKLVLHSDASILAYLFSGGQTQLAANTGCKRGFAVVLHESRLSFSTAVAQQLGRAKVNLLCESASLASEGFVSLVYGQYEVLGTITWGVPYPVLNRHGHAAVIQNNVVEYDDKVTMKVLSSTVSYPFVAGVPDLE